MPSDASIDLLSPAAPHSTPVTAPPSSSLKSLGAGCLFLGSYSCTPDDSLLGPSSFSTVCLSWCHLVYISQVGAGAGWRQKKIGVGLQWCMKVCFTSLGATKKSTYTMDGCGSMAHTFHRYVGVPFKNEWHWSLKFFCILRGTFAPAMKADSDPGVM